MCGGLARPWSAAPRRRFGRCLRGTKHWKYSYTKAVLGHRTPRATEILSLPMCDLDGLGQSTQTQH